MQNELIFKSGKIKVADLFCSTWGYEQTNVTFYQVVGLKGKTTVILKEIKKTYHYAGDMSGTVTPQPGEFVDSTETVKRVRDDGSELVIKMSSYEYATQTTAEESHGFTSYY